MSHDDDSLTRWIVGAVAGALVALLGFFAKFVFSGVFKRLDAMQVEIKASNDEQLEKLSRVADAVSENKTARAVTELRLAHLEASYAAFAQKYDDMVGFLQAQGYRKRDG